MHLLESELRYDLLHEEGVVNLWPAEAMRELHKERLRGPWGRLYVKEMSALRQLLSLLDAPLPDPNAYKAALQERKSREI
jgi:hypothetical protein